MQAPNHLFLEAAVEERHNELRRDAELRRLRREIHRHRRLSGRTRRRFLRWS